MNFTIVSLLIFLAVFIPNVKSANIYTIQLFNGSTTTSPMNIYIPPSYVESGSSNIRLNPYVNISSGTDIITSYYSPYDVLIATSEPPTTTGNIQCLNLGQTSTSVLGENGTHEINYKVTYDGVVNEFFGSYIYNIQTSLDDVKISNRIEDTNNYKPFTYYYHECDTSPFDVPFYDSLDYTNFGICKSVEVTPATKTRGFNCIASNSLIQYYFPFNSSNGFIKYNLQANPSDCQSPARWRIYPLSNSSDITTLCDSNSCSGNITLKDNNIYVLTQWWDFCNSGGVNLYAPEINLTIGVFQGDYDCSDYSECLDGIQHRTCIDQANKLPDKIEYRSCAIIELENLTLGFEDFYRATDITVCIPSWSITGCSYTKVSNKQVDRPKNWTVIENPASKEYFLSMTSDWSSEGTRSLRMWYIPPAEDGEPKATPPYCDSLSQGKIPQIYKGINDSFFLTKNITFPASNMIISFDYLKCKSNVQKHDELKVIFDLALICPEVCYGNCSEQPNGRIYFNLIDTVTSKSVLPTSNGWFDFAKDYPQTLQFDLSNLGIIAGRTYNLVFAIYPESFQDQTGHCAMFDNIRYSVLRDDIVCTSRCIGIDYYNSRLVNNSCVTTITENALQCLSVEQKALREDCEEFCQGTTLYIPTELCIAGEFVDYEEVENSEQCEDELVTPSIKEPIIDVSGGEPSNEWLNNFTTPLFIIFIAIIIVMTLITIKSKSWQIGLLSAFLILIALGTLIPELAGIVVLFIVIAGLLFAREFNKHRSGDNNG